MIPPQLIIQTQMVCSPNVQHFLLVEISTDQTVNSRPNQKQTKT